METIYVIISRNSPNLETLRVLEERPKAYKVQNADNEYTCWIPKSGLELRKPGVPSYEDEYILRDWFARKLNRYQEKVLGILE